MTIVHVIGTGTIGEPLIGLLADHKEKLGIDEVTFHKRTPLRHEVPKVNSLLGRGAKLATNTHNVRGFENLGHEVTYVGDEAILRADAVIDCTPAGNENKAHYEQLEGPKVYMAQGSENGFGLPYAWGINDDIVNTQKFVQVVSCNTHNICSLVKTIYRDKVLSMVSGDFVCIRRASDLSQNSDFIPSVEVGAHGDQEFGTHHAADATRVFNTMENFPPTLFSSSAKVPTQYMHTIRFQLRNNSALLTKDSVIAKLQVNPRIALTDKMSSNLVFSFGRDHGFYGRLLTQTVVPTNTLHVSQDGTTLTGFCFTPQDGNALLSSVACAMWKIHGENPTERMMNVFGKWMFQEV